MAISRIFLAQRKIVPGSAAQKEPGLVFFDIEIPHPLEHGRNGRAFGKVQIRAPSLPLQVALDCAWNSLGRPIGINIRAGRLSTDLCAPGDSAMKLPRYALIQLEVDGPHMKTSPSHGRGNQHSFSRIHFKNP